MHPDGGRGSRGEKLHCAALLGESALFNYVLTNKRSHRTPGQFDLAGLKRGAVLRWTFYSRDFLVAFETFRMMEIQHEGGPSVFSLFSNRCIRVAVANQGDPGTFALFGISVLELCRRLIVVIDCTRDNIPLCFCARYSLKVNQ